ncbi:alpha/beta fold hydrolase [Fibrella forsythiae]|uniref:Alpha/beta hydrolase n=1 Tax=Fibrella forsythiae TaxID=2817061 RepID=A0ABS3JSS9_9BACT|nr:alpha/beta hydrolase [Fibrella forsythiae]MBO0953073.1 alpha/beta hydrolase [Fibrella forsythiae]
MYKQLLLLLLLLLAGCTSRKKTTVDPFHYDPKAYELVKLHYQLEGQGDTTLVFIHGWNLDHTYWQEQAREFRSSYRLVLLDLAGCGASGTNRINWTVESFARDITSILKKERLSNVILVAHSMGGEIALDVAATNPRTVIGIIGIDNLKEVGMTLKDGDEEGIQAYSREFMANYPKMAEAMARSMIVSRDSAVVHRIVTSYRQADPRIAVPTLLNLYPKAAAAKYKLQQMPFAMQFIMSTNSPYDETALKTYCKQGYRIVRLDSAGHFPMIERPRAFNNALHELLAGR